MITDIAIDKYATECGADGINFKGSKVTSTKEMVQKALDKGFKLGVYVLDSPVTMGAYYSWGVRYFVTDYRTPSEISKESVTEETDGTAYAAFRDLSIELGGKTGSAEAGHC